MTSTSDTDRESRIDKLTEEIKVLKKAFKILENMSAYHRDFSELLSKGFDAIIKETSISRPSDVTLAVVAKIVKDTNDSAHRILAKEKSKGGK